MELTTKNTKKRPKLTIKQDRFCREYVIYGNAHLAYIKSYDISYHAEKEDWTYTEASRLLTNPKIQQRIEEIKAELANHSDYDVNRILLELEQAREQASIARNHKAMIQATMEKARILGLEIKQALKARAKSQAQLKG